MSKAPAEAASGASIWRSADDLAGIRAAAAVASAAQAAVREGVVRGITERELWQIGESVVRDALGGDQVVAEVDLMTGERTAVPSAHRPATAPSPPAIRFSSTLLRKLVAGGPTSARLSRSGDLGASCDGVTTSFAGPLSGA